ncbi:MAG TPA: aldehyde dehydrogenase, partial [Acidobacteriota bacterium]|nr:aldehyde dehydrogenase [Acidobacteriota bacterium]
QAQKEFFRSGRTRDVDFRINQLRKLRDTLDRNESRIYQALQADLRKPAFEAYGGELGILLEEIRHTIGNLRSWTKPQRVPTPMSLFPSQSRILHDPRGVVLIIGPWNYPFQLLLTPLVGAIAAGNCAVLKPSELAPQSSRLISEMIAGIFPSAFVAVVEGDRETASMLLAEPWNYIFFTGGTAVGRIVAEAAARHLTPVTLELGGKSPCVVARDARLDVTARKIVWAKYYNAGQSCVSPDYLLVHASVKKPLLERIRAFVREFFGADPSRSPDYARIINASHFDRLEKLLSAGKVALGGSCNREQLYIEPTVLDEVKMEDPVMADEVFGPILPVLEYEDLNDAIGIIEQRPGPLSLYVFTRDKKFEKELLSRVAFGGGCVNDAMIHLANPYLPFGGIGSSGLGAYHGRYSFDTFSHRKSIVSSPFFPDIKIRYQPYLEKLRLLKKLMK